MRFSIKAKLAGAFGTVIILSMVTGAIAYNKLSALSGAEERTVAQALRLKMAADVMDGIQGQQRSESRMIYATNEKDTQDNYKAMLARRDKVLKLRDELYGKASETGKQLLDAAAAPIKRMNELEEQAGNLALLNSNNKAAELWKGEGQPAVRDLDTTLDSMIAELNKNASESQRLVTLLMTAKFDAARIARAIISAYSASNVADVDGEVKEALQKLAAVKADVAKLSAEQASGAATALAAELDRLTKSAEKAASLASEAGNIKAGAIAGGEAARLSLKASMPSNSM